jgi:pimeloyl-ACP methyl ester carboxylesterase
VPALRQVYTSRFVPGATAEQMSWFNELCRRTTSPENAARLLEARANVDVVDLLEKVRTPTLVLHARDDQVVPIEEGRMIASGVPGAEFVELDSKNHILLEGEPPGNGSATPFSSSLDCDGWPLRRIRCSRP